MGIRDPRFERLAGISHSHVYNLRGSRTYRPNRTTWTKTKGSNVAVAVCAAPEPNGVAGLLRVDTVHQGDRDGVKGLYLINLVDQITQFEFVGAVCAISERGLLPLLEGLMFSFPFQLHGFHADNALRWESRVSRGHKLLAAALKRRSGRTLADVGGSRRLEVCSLP